MITDVGADGTGTAKPGAEELGAESPSTEGLGTEGPGAGGSGADGTGTVLPELEIDVTPTFVIAGAIATRDFQDVHHDRDRAVERGAKDIFVNILTTTGLVQRYVTDWAGPEALVRQIAIRLGVPCYAGDKLTFSGKVTQAGEKEWVVEVVGRCSLGDHVTGTVRIRLREPDGPDGPGVPDELDGPDEPSGLGTPGGPGGSAP
jgi:3-oxo-4,17-pregnadiene-20-carboxyl-CoA hydratase beta subunit